MARWKDRVNFLLTVIELLFLSLTVDALQAKCAKTHCFLDRVGQFEPRFQGEGVVPGEYFLVSPKLHILLSDSANCTMLLAVVLTQYRRVTERQTDRRTELL